MGMIALRLEIDAWDCFLYSGVLYVVSADNELLAYDWNKVIGSLTRNQGFSEGTRLAAHCAFSRADYVYGTDWSPALDKAELLAALRRGVRRLMRSEHAIDASTLKEALLFKTNVPLSNIPVSFTIYKNNLYFGASDGVFSVELEQRRKNAPQHKRHPVWGGRAVSLSGGGISSLAISAGSEGALRYRTNGEYPSYSDSKTIQQLSPSHTTHMDWAELNLFRSSALAPGELIAVKKTSQVERKLERAPDRIIGTAAFPEGTFDYSWAFGNRIFGIKDNRVSIFQLEQRHIRALTEVKRLRVGAGIKLERDFPLREWKGAVIAAGTASFGTIIECSNAVVLAYPDGRTWNVPYEVAKWRIYNRAKYYWNQLHLINERDVIILGFTDKFFSDNALGPVRPTDRAEA